MKNIHLAQCYRHKFTVEIHRKLCYTEMYACLNKIKDQ